MLFAVALAVGLSPELLPGFVSVTLSAGARRMAQRGVIVRHLEAIENLGSVDVLCADKTGTPTSGTMTLQAATAPDGTASPEALCLAYLNAAFETGIDNPLHAALVAAGEQAGLGTGSLRRVDEIPYDFLREPLTVARFREQDAQGLRLLALATRSVEPRSAYTRDNETGMCFTGFLLFVDAPKPTAAGTLQRLAALGIHIKIVTGNNRHVAAHVAHEVGLDAGAMLTGEQIDTMKGNHEGKP